MKEKQGNRKLQVSHIYIYELMTGVVKRGSHIIAVYSNSNMQQHCYLTTVMDIL
jgi:hypothetical protein